MKKLLLALLIAFSVLTLASCDLDGMGDIGNLGGILGNGNNNNTSTFDPNNVTMVSAYTEAQTLGFKGTLDEFIEMISGKDGADGEDGKNGWLGYAYIAYDRDVAGWDFGEYE